MTARMHLAWLMWCYNQGYVNAADREKLTNWLEEDPASDPAEDAILRIRLLEMADEILSAIDAEPGAA